MAIIALLFFLLPCQAQQTQEQLASHYFSNGDFAQAAELYEDLYKRAPNKFYYQMLYRSYVELKQFKDAERLVERRIKQYPKDLYVSVDLGQVYELKGDRKKADKTYESVIKKIGYDSKQIGELAQAFESAGHPEWAIKVYLFAREKSKNEYIYVGELATLYERVGDYESMMREYFDLLDKQPGMMSSIQVSLQRILAETSNPRLTESLKTLLIKRVQEHPDSKHNLEMMIWFSLQQKDFQFAMEQAKAVDARFPEQSGEMLMRVAKIAQSDAAYDVARECYSSLVKKGKESPYYFESRVGELNVQFAQINRNFPIENRKQQAADILYDILDIPKIDPHQRDNAKLALGDLLLFAGEIWDASLLYMQVDKANKNDVLGSLAKFKNAKLSYYNHDFLWAKSQLDVLRASTSKLIANDAMELSLLISDNMEEDSSFTMLEKYAAADLLLYRNLLDSAWNAFDDISHSALSHSLFDEVLMQKAKIRIQQQRYAEADTLLQQLVDFYPADILADDALLLLAQLNEEKLNHPERARDCYEKLILDYPASLYVDEARKRYRALAE